MAKRGQRWVNDSVWCVARAWTVLLVDALTLILTLISFPAFFPVVDCLRPDGYSLCSLLACQQPATLLIWLFYPRQNLKYSLSFWNRSLQRFNRRAIDHRRRQAKWCWSLAQSKGSTRGNCFRAMLLWKTLPNDYRDPISRSGTGKPLIKSIEVPRECGLWKLQV